MLQKRSVVTKLTVQWSPGNMALPSAVSPQLPRGAVFAPCRAERVSDIGRRGPPCRIFLNQRLRGRQLCVSPFLTQEKIRCADTRLCQANDGAGETRPQSLPRLSEVRCAAPVAPGGPADAKPPSCPALGGGAAVCAARKGRPCLSTGDTNLGLVRRQAGERRQLPVPFGGLRHSDGRRLSPR